MVKSLICLFLVFLSLQDTLFASSKDLIQEASALCEAGDFKSAILLLRDITSDDGDYLRAQELLITAYHGQKDTQKALEIAQSLMNEYQGLSADYYIEVGNIYVEEGKEEQGLEVYLEGLKHYVYHHLLIYNVGYTYYRLGAFGEAVSYFQQVALLRPFFSPTHQMLGNIMSQTRFRTKAILSYLTYLAIEPNENWALIRLNALVNDALREEGRVQLDMNNEAFDYYDNLLRSRASFDDRYRSGIGFEVPAAQQNELLMRKLEYIEGTGDFWMDFYVPYLREISDQGLTTDFVYFLLYSSGHESVTKWVEKHEEEKEAWVAITNQKLHENRLQNTRTILDSTGTFSHWYADDGDLTAIGFENEAGQKTGPFEYYHDNGRLRARGRYDGAGHKIGLWRYYHDNGVLRTVEHYNTEGEIVGTVWSSDKEDRLVSKRVYVDGKMDGTYRSFYPSGTVKEEVDYEWGRKHGLERHYFKSGKLKEELRWVKDQKDGWHRKYQEDGSLQEEQFYGNGKL